MNPVENYLRDLYSIRLTGGGVNETSYYTPLSNLLNEIGKTLKPKVHCVGQLQDLGAGHPDFGLFTAEQFQRTATANTNPVTGQLPLRGVLEVKGLAENIQHTIQDEQVRRYLNRYGLVLVTNYREFVLLGKDSAGRPVRLEAYTLAANEAEFWQATANSHRTAEEHAERFSEYLKRVMLHNASLTTPKDLAWFLASYARDARTRIEQAARTSEGNNALAGLRSALEEALGIRFEGSRGEHFFRSTLVQTLFYGIFSAWVLWSKRLSSYSEDEEEPRFNWHDTGYNLHVPVIQALFEQVSLPTRLRNLNLVQVLDWTGAILNRVDRASFFEHFAEEEAVQYFYEPFLEAFDPELRKDLGIWYTPPEVVQYMVSRVDTVLRQELGITEGLADERVFILDPCCGTGAYLVEVLKRIATTLEDRGLGELLGEEVRKAATERVLGFEILPAPFVVAHLQLGLLLQDKGARLNERERVGVYLTNALTGWDLPNSPRQQLTFPELQQERDAADKVKREVPILVILGNPPYNGYAGVAVNEERELTTTYRTTRQAPAPQGQGLNDLYVRFFRMAERRIVEGTGQGVVCLISNYSWLDGLSFTGMRERYLETFDRIWIDCLNGDKFKTGKLTPEGEPDPSVFSTDWNKEGIQVGTAISLLVRKANHPAPSPVLFRHLWGRTKRAQLLETANQTDNSLYQPLDPPLALGLPLMPSQVEAGYTDWPLLPDIFPASFPGVKTSRDDVVLDVDRDRLVQRMQQYFDQNISHEEMRLIAPGAMENSNNFNAIMTRDYLRKRGFLAQNIIRYCYRPFDIRWLYWEPETKLLDRNRADYLPHIFEGNLWIEARQKQPVENFDRGYVIRVLGDQIGNGMSSFFPLYLKPPAQATLFDSNVTTQIPNLSDQASQYLQQLGLSEPEIFYHTAAILNSPTYRLENNGALRLNWPRIPLPANREMLEASANLGRQIVALLDTEKSLAQVTTGAIRPELRVIAPLMRTGSDALNLAVTAHWGSAGKGGITMPGKGKLITRNYTGAELAALEAGAAQLGLTAEQMRQHLGETTCDIYLNATTFWQNVPLKVWEYTIGGYQVIKKWLSYREQDLLGRTLTPTEAGEVMNMARRIAALLLLEPQLDASYQTIKQQLYQWPGSGS